MVFLRYAIQSRLLFIVEILLRQIILTGISGGMVACVCSSRSRKHEYLLYCSFSVLILNTINLIILEFGQFKELFHENVQRQMSTSKEYNVLESQYGTFMCKTNKLSSITIRHRSFQVELLQRPRQSYR